MSLTKIEQSLLLATNFRGNLPDQVGSTACCDQVITLSLFYSGDISYVECAERFGVRRDLGSIYDDEGELRDEIRLRYQELIELIRSHPDLIRGAGNLDYPAHPTYTACRLTPAGDALVPSLIRLFPAKPEFPDWPDRRTFSAAE